MLEIKLLNFYIKKYWFLLFLMVAYQVFIISLFIFYLFKPLEKPSDDTVETTSIGLWKMVYIYSNLDLIFIGVFLFPVLHRIVNENSFYKNLLLKNRNYFKGSFNIAMYFFAISLFVIISKKVILYSFEYATIKNFYLGKVPFTNFELSFFGEVHLALVSILIGKIISLVCVRKSYLFYSLLTLVFLLILGIFQYIFMFSLLDYSRTDNIPFIYFSNTSIKITYWIKIILEKTPLAGGIILTSLSAFGVNSKNFVNFNEHPLFKDISLNHSLAIWVIISFFVYVLVLLFMFYFNKTKYIIIKNYLNTFIRKVKTKPQYI